MLNYKGKLDIVSWNIGGITSPKKRKLIIKHLGKQNPDLAFLQETHLKMAEIPKLRSKWVGEVIGTPCCGRKSGVAILFNKNLSYKIIHTDLDTYARYIILQVKINEMRFVLCNIYAPNTFCRVFWENLKVKLFPFISDNLIIGGDFNLSLCPELERFSKKNIKLYMKQAKYMKNFCHKLKLVDIWRVHNPDCRTFTCESKTFRTFSRIDFFLLAKSMVFQKVEAKINDIVLSDHASISVSLCISSNLQGKNQIFIFPRYMFKNVRFIRWIKQRWKDYCTHNIAYLNKIETFWEASKTVLRGEIKAYMCKKKKIEIMREIQLANQVKNFYRRYINMSNRTNWDLYIRAREERDIFLKQRSNEEERKLSLHFKGNYGSSAKYLAKLVKNRKKNNYILAIKEGGQRYTDPADIMKTFFSYYQKFYSQTLNNEDNQKEFWAQIKTPLVSSELLNKLNAPISEEEIQKGIDKAKLGKAAGPDFLPIEYYKILADEVKPILIKLFNSYFFTGCTPSPYFSAANISLILKKDKNPEEMTSYRPISVLNIDYKLLTAIIADRLMICMDNLIHGDQTGFIASRTLSKNMRKIITFLDYMWNRDRLKKKQFKYDSALLTLDAEKAFDSIEWDYLLAALARFGFKNQFVSFICNLFNGPTSFLLVNGTLSPGVVLKKGTRQGCPLSPLLFNLALEPLAIWLRDKLEGIPLGEHSIKILLYADDLLICLYNTAQMIPKILQCLNLFGSFSGYKVNYNKSELMWIDKTRQSIVQIPFKVVETLRYLGIFLHKNPYNWYRLNYQALVQKIKTDLELWASFPLSISARVSLIKVIVFPRLLYPLQNLPLLLSNKDTQTLYSSFSKFIWNGKKKSRIALDKLMQDHESAGLAVPNIRLYNLAALAKIALDWLADTNWSTLVSLESFYVTPYSLKALIHILPKDLPKHIYSLVSFKNIILAWHKLCDIIEVDNMFSEFLPIIGNPDFRPGNNQEVFRSWARKDLVSIYQLLIENGQVNSFENLSQIFFLPNKDFFAYLQIRHYIRSRPWFNSEQSDWSVIKLCLSIAKTRPPSISLLYSIMLSKQSQDFLEKLRTQWQSFFPNIDAEIIKSSFVALNKCRVPKSWKESHFKLINNYYYTPAKMFRMYPGQFFFCPRCQFRNADIYHIFWACPKIQQFLQKVAFWLNKLYYCNFLFSFENIIFLNTENNGHLHKNILNTIILLIRQSIIKNWKAKKLQGFSQFIKELQTQIIFESFHLKIAKEKTIKKFMVNWLPIIKSYPLSTQKQILYAFLSSDSFAELVISDDFPADWIVGYRD